VDPLLVIWGGLLLVLFVVIVLLGLFSKRSPRDYLDWKPTRTPEADAENELEDVAQMLEAQNALRRRRGAPELTEADVRARVREDREELRRWRESSS
jgi:hypothetical protein